LSTNQNITPESLLSMYDIQLSKTRVNRALQHISEESAKYEGDFRLEALSPVATTCSLIMSSDLGVAIGNNATNVISASAQELAFEHDVITPLFEKTYVPLNASGDIKIIKRKIGEPRGIHFAKIIDELRNRDHPAASHFSIAFGFSLLTETTQSVSGLVRRRIKNNHDIAQELGMLQRIVDSPVDNSGLSESEHAALESILNQALIAKTEIDTSVQATNVQMVTEKVEERHASLRKKRILYRVGALACVIASTSSIPFINGSYERLPIEITDATAEMIDVSDHQLMDAVNLLNSETSELSSTDVPERLLDDLEQQLENYQESLTEDHVRDDDVELIDSVIGIIRSTRSEGKDGEITQEQIDKFNKILADVEGRNYDPKVARYVLSGMILLGFNALALAFNYAASKKGGKNDPLHKVLKDVENGAIPPTSANNTDLLPGTITAIRYNAANYNRTAST
jgi:hypothetical protein